MRWLGAALILSLATNARAQQPLAKWTPSTGSFAGLFGDSVAISGERAIVGAPGDGAGGTGSGAAYVFDAGMAVELFKLVPIGLEASDRFGDGVAISGDRAVVGAPGDDDGGSGAGALYVFDVATGAQLFKLLASDAEANDQLGQHVALDGDLAIAGVPFDNPLGPSSGSAYVFDIATGQQLFKLTASDGAPLAQFGRSVGISAGRALVGAPQAAAPALGSGAAYLFDTATGLELTRLTASDGEASDFFGSGVAIRGLRAVVGAPGDDDQGNSAGAAYVFDVASGQELSKLVAADGASLDFLGESVALAPHLAIAGAWGDDDNGPESGAAYAFEPETGAQIFKMTASDGDAGDELGRAVAIDGARILVGSRGDDDLSFNSGAAHAFFGAPAPATYCTAKVNSCGSVPAIGFTGTSSASANNGFTLACSNTAGRRSGLLLYSDQGRGAVALIGGVLCVDTADLQRSIPLKDSQGTLGSCDGRLDLDMNAFAAGALGGDPHPSLRIAGVRITCQFWGRDRAVLGLLSNALEYYVGP